MLLISLSAFLGLLIQREIVYSSLGALLCLTSSGVLFAYVLYLRRRGLRSIYGEYFGIALLFVSLFIVRGQFIQQVESVPESLHTVKERSFLIEDVKKEEAWTRYTVSFNEDGSEKKAYIIYDILPAFKAGDFVIGSTSLKESKENIQYDRYLARKGIVGTFLYPKLEKVEGDSSSFRVEMVKMREALEERLAQYLPFEEGDLARASLFGQHSLTKEENDLFVRAGISHIVALSGFNLTVLITFLSLLLFFLPFYVRMALTLILLSVYISMTEMGGSLVRASVGVFIALLLLARGYAAQHKKVLFAGTFFLLLVSPETVLSDISFQFSFLAMLSILFVYPALCENYVLRFTGITQIFLSLCAVSFSVTLTIMPYSAFLFEKVSLYGVFATIVTTPLVPLLTILSLLVILFSFLLPFVSLLLSYPLLFIARIIFSSGRVTSDLPFALVDVTPSLSFLCVYYTVLFLCVIFVPKLYTERKEKEKMISQNKESGIIEGVMRW